MRRLTLLFALVWIAATARAAEPTYTSTFSTVQPNPTLANSLSGDTFGSNQTFRDTVSPQPAGSPDFTGTTDLESGSFSLSTGGIASGVPDVGVAPAVIGGSAPSSVPTNF